ncbi:hypothetical protein B566_EDAN003647 [Ephemera danica]|nr:hypothetical protein B566_EDAN003647 [Ephemera danica]
MPIVSRDIQPALGTACRDGCYAGSLRLIGATLDCSSSDHGSANDEEQLEEYDYEDLDQELNRIVDGASNTEISTTTQESTQETSDQSRGDSADEDDHEDAESQPRSIHSCHDEDETWENGEAALTDASSTSSLSCGDADSVIYVGPRETFKCVDELLVAAEESLCLQPRPVDRASPAPLGAGLRSASADSGVSSQTGGSPLLCRSSIASPQTPQARSPLAASASAVVAIDLGTTHSGYAYSVCREPGHQVHVMRRWEGGDSGLVNHKTPTALLLTPEGEFHSFGSAARDAYLDLPATEIRRWLYFDRFKMALHRNAELHRDTPIPASNGDTQPALSVFAHALRHFRGLALRELRERCGDRRAPDTNTVRWVVTVPAMWRQPARQLIREAAYQAGMCDETSAERLLVLLEPEAAAVQCREQILQEMMNNSISDDSGGGLELPVRFLVADCGGGTVDITLHEMAGPGAALSELLPASGGPYGATGIDREFESLLDNVFGNELMAQFRSRRPAAHAELMASFEARKRGATPGHDRAVALHPPFAFVDFLRKQSGKDVEHAIRRHGRREVEWCREGTLRLRSSTLLQLFSGTVQRVVEHVGEVLDDPVLEKKPAQCLFLVGGFSESAVLQEALRESFSHRLQVIAPQPSSLATLRGAVLYGLDASVIAARRSRHSYGVGVLTRFIPGLHPAGKLVVSRDGGRWCADVLDSLVRSGQPIAAGHAETRRYAAASAGQRHAVLHVYSAEPRTSAELDMPQFVTDAGVVRCGTLTLALDPDDATDEDVAETMQREVQAQLFFSGTELVVTATSVRTGSSVRVHLDFLAAD